MVIDLYGYKMWCESTTENSNFILKTMDPDVERLSGWVVTWFLLGYTVRMFEYTVRTF